VRSGESAASAAIKAVANRSLDVTLPITGGSVSSKAQADN
jgi:hypothetical protein